MEALDPVMEAPDEPQQRWTTSTQISGWPQRQSVKEKRSTGGRPPLPGVCSRRVVAEPAAPAASTPAPSPATPRQGCAPPAPRDQRRGRSRCVAVGEKERKGRRERLRERQRGRERRAGDGGVRASRGRNGGGRGRDEADYVDPKSEAAVYIRWAGSGVEAGSRWKALRSGGSGFQWNPIRAITATRFKIRRLGEFWATWIVPEGILSSYDGPRKKCYFVRRPSADSSIWHIFQNSK